MGWIAKDVLMVDTLLGPQTQNKYELSQIINSNKNLDWLEEDFCSVVGI